MEDKKWIDLLKEDLSKSKRVFKKKEIEHTFKVDNFYYDLSTYKDSISLFLSTSDIGYLFKIEDNKVVWEHPENAQCLFSEEVFDKVNYYVKEVLKLKAFM